MSDLAAFLAENIAEDHRRAEAMEHFAVHEEPYYSCPASRTPEDVAGTDLESGEENCDCFLAERRAFALRLAEAGRKILAEHARVESGIGPPDICRVCWTTQKAGPLMGDAWPCNTVRAAVAVWSDKPGYDPGWA